MKVGENKTNRDKNMVFSFQILFGIIEMSDRESWVFYHFPLQMRNGLADL